MVDRCASLALPRGTPLPSQWPMPELVVPDAELADWRRRSGLRPTEPLGAVAPGAGRPPERWPAASHAALARRLAGQEGALRRLGGPAQSPLAAASARTTS